MQLVCFSLSLYVPASHCLHFPKSFSSLYSPTPQYLQYNIIGCFIFPTPIYFILLLVFSSVWTRRRLWKIILVSLLIWSILLVTYSIIWIASSKSAFIVFIIGIPAQIITLMSFGIITVKPLRAKKNESSEENNQ